MSVLKKLKKTIPWADNPDPKADISAADFQEPTSRTLNPDEDTKSQKDKQKNPGDSETQETEDHSDKTDSESRREGNHPDQSNDRKSENGSEAEEPDGKGSKQNSSGNPNHPNTNGDETKTNQQQSENNDNAGSGQTSLSDFGNDDNCSNSKGKSDSTVTSQSEVDSPSSNSDVNSDGNDSSKNQTVDQNNGPVEAENPSSQDGQENDENYSGDNRDDTNSGTPAESSSNPQPCPQSERTKIEPRNNFSKDPPGTGHDEFNPPAQVNEEHDNRTTKEKAEYQQQLEAAQKELEKFEDALENSSGSGSLEQIKFNINPSNSSHNPRWKEALQDKDRILPLLEKRLQRSRRDKWKRGRKSGSKIDTKRAWAVRAKRTNIMKRRNPGTKKRYSAFLVLDRSGSMRGDKIKMAEEALVRYALAMEPLDIEITVIDLYEDTARIISPFGVDIKTAKDDLLSRKRGGSTPMSDVIALTRERSKLSRNDPFLIAITDGKPEDEERYYRELDQSNFPVMGITVAPSMSQKRGRSRQTDQNEFYDLHKYVSTKDDILKQLEELTLEIFF